MRCARRWAERSLLLAVLAGAACAPRITAPPPPPPPAPGAPGAPEAPAPALPRAEPAVRVGLHVDTTAVELGSSTGFALLEAGTAERVLARAAANERWTITAAPGGGLQATANGRVVASAPGPLLARPEGGGTLTIAGKPYRGTALVQAAATPGRVTAINVVEMEEYLLGVVPHEIGRVGEDLLEAAKAQAVAARTYAIAYLGRRAALGFDVFATVQDQVYGGAASEHDVTSRAVRETRGEVALYQDRPIEAYYHSTCAGRTEAIQEVWPGEPPRPYLVSVVDVDPRTGQAYDHFSSRFRWTTRWTAAQLNEILGRTLADSLPPGVGSVGEVRDIRILERTPSGRVARMRIETSTTTFHVGRDRIRWILLTPQGPPLNSSLFDIELVRDASGRLSEIVANGGGWGHGIGMCQVGAMGRARAGQDYRTILQTYYPGIEVRRLY
jgi:stage II sporulation protein D